MEKGDCLYFGCGTIIGHYLWASKDGRMNHVGFDERVFLPFKWTRLDGTFLPPKYRWKEGHAALTHIKGISVLSFADNTIDSRPASHSTFAIQGIFDFTEAVEIARAAFPNIWERMAFEVIDKTQ